MKFIDIVFDGPPSPEGPRFVEVEDDQGRGIRLGEWFKRPDEYWVLRVPYMVEESQTVFVTVQNTDLTEGRGNRVPIHICNSRTMAERLGRGRDVQGTDCKVYEKTAVLIDGKWLGPCHIEYATQEDHNKDTAAEEKKAAIVRAREAGVSEDDIKAMLQG